jgi:dolichol kinase
MLGHARKCTDDEGAAAATNGAYPDDRGGPNPERRRYDPASPGKAYPSPCRRFLVNEIGRKLVHILFGIGIALFILYAGKAIALPVLLVSLLAGLILSDAISRGHHIPVISRLVHDLERPGILPGKGAILFVFSSAFCLFFFPVPVVVPAVLTLSVLDGVSALAGQYAGRHRIWNGKSWEGTGAGIAITALVLCILLPPPQALAVALVAGLIELVSPVDDNLVIPIAVCLLLTVLP